MANPQRAAQLAKLHKVLKSNYKPFPFDHKRPLLEMAVFAALLENSPFEQAEQIFASLLQKYFDWNEVRVSTITELGESLAPLFDSPARATQLKKVLQGIFEAKYTFDIEILKKQNLGAAVKELQTMTGASSFIVNFVAQNSLGGHAIGLDRGAWEILVITGIATPQEAATGELNGLERTIPKNKGVEFFTLLHQAGAEYLHNPNAPTARKLITSVNSAAVFPKKGESALKLPEPKPVPAKAKPADKAVADAKSAPTKPGDKAAADKAAAAKANTDKSKPVDSKQVGKPEGKPALKGKEATPVKPVPGKAAAGKVTAKAPEKAAPEKNHAAKTAEKKPAPKPAKPEVKKLAPKKALPVVAAKKTAGKPLAKRKPR
jgi:endonuclease III